MASEVRSLDLVVSKESGLENDNFEACPSSPAHIGYGPLSEEEILITQLGYGEDEEENAVADGEGNHDSDEEDDDYVISDAEEGLDDASGDFSIEDELSAHAQASSPSPPYTQQHAFFPPLPYAPFL